LNDLNNHLKIKKRNNIKDKLPQSIETDFAGIIAEIKAARNRALQSVNKELVFVSIRG
jgi:hypothetical protein